MFKKTTNYLKKTAKSVLSSGRLKTLALMLLVGGGIAMAQNSAGDYTAGTTALTTVTEEIAKYVPIVVKLCYAIAGVVAVVGAISVYIAMNNEEQDVKKKIMKSTTPTTHYLRDSRSPLNSWEYRDGTYIGQQPRQEEPSSASLPPTV
mgnify:CR=1 FL=1